MARTAYKPFEERVFQGSRISIALEDMGITQAAFLEAYDAAQLERKPRRKVAEMEATIAELTAKLEALGEAA